MLTTGCSPVTFNCESKPASLPPFPTDPAAMFTGIIEALGTVRALHPEGSNLTLELSCPFVSELKVDQSLSHNGVCLTVVEVGAETYKVTAIAETLQRTNLGQLAPGHLVNLERCMAANGRFDGHVVQGHVDQLATLEMVVDLEGSWLLRFRHAQGPHVLVEKGSVTVNGISLTCFDIADEAFSVAIIPYTWQHTNLHQLVPGSRVNLEFDIIGKYVARILAGRAL